jgi:hypothetical protein
MGKSRSDKWRNNRVRETLNLEPILNYIERRNIQWYGHVVRMQDYGKPKTDNGSQKEEKKRQRKTKEDLGGLCDRCGQEKRKDFSRSEETGSR